MRYGSLAGWCAGPYSHSNSIRMLHGKQNAICERNVHRDICTREDSRLPTNTLSQAIKWGEILSYMTFVLFFCVFVGKIHVDISGLCLKNIRNNSNTTNYTGIEAWLSGTTKKNYHSMYARHLHISSNTANDLCIEVSDEEWRLASTRFDCLCIFRIFSICWRGMHIIKTTKSVLPYQ